MLTKPQFLYLDIETIPTENPDVIADIVRGIKAPSQFKKPESIAEWERENKGAAAIEAIDKTALNGAKGSILCIGYAFDMHEPQIAIRSGEKHESEAAMLAAFIDAVHDDSHFGFPTIVGHNVAGFDLRFIVQRCIVNGIRLPMAFPRDPKPWSDDVHDTMTMWAGARGFIGLDDLCQAVGVPGKSDIDGSMVAALYREGKTDIIHDYCKQDVERARSVHRRMLQTFGKAA